MFNVFEQLVYLVCGVGLLIFINWIGSLSRSKGYVNFEFIQNQFLGYNLFFRILTPSVYIVFLAIFFFKTKLGFLNSSIWSVVVYYFIIQSIVFLVYRRFRVINLILYLVVIGASVLLSYWIQRNAIDKGIHSLLPESGDIKTEIWLVIIGYFYFLFNNLELKGNNDKKKRVLIRSYKNLFSKYGPLLSKKVRKNEVLRDTTLAIMIFEDYNRPPFIRGIERLLAKFGLAKTTGIMQISSKKSLSDKESINIFCKKIVDFYDKTETSLRKFGFVRYFSKDYNGDEYADNIMEIYNIVLRVK